VTYNIISTGSKGNAVLLDGCILIDCGVPFKAIEPYVDDLKLVLLTHIHGDHFKLSTLCRLAALRPALRFACCDWLVPELAKCVKKRQIDVVKPNYLFVYDGFCTVMPIGLVHDVPNAGWHIYLGDESAFYATDTGTLEGVSAKHYSLYLIEANHTTEDIERRANEKIERGEYAYEIRASANHLSEEQALDWLAQNVGVNSEYVLLHQHESDGDLPL
jgi:hypothetical protein